MDLPPEEDPFDFRGGFFSRGPVVGDPARQILRVFHWMLIDEKVPMVAETEVSGMCELVYWAMLGQRQEHLGVGSTNHRRVI
jgi:hypothetical protein